MKTKRQQPVGRASSAFGGELHQRRMEDHLKATQASFKAAVERADALGPAANGVIAGPQEGVGDKNGPIRV